MKRITILASGITNRSTRLARVSKPATPESGFTGSAREETGADLLEAAQALETEQQALLEASPLEQSYCETLALYVQAKHDQVEQIEGRQENLIDRQKLCLQQTQSSALGRLSLPGAKRARQAQQVQQQARLQTLHGRLEAVREIKEGMGLHSPRIEELATRKMRADHPEFAADWDAMRAAARRHELFMRKKDQERKQAQGVERSARSQTLGLSTRPA